MGYFFLVEDQGVSSSPLCPCNPHTPPDPSFQFSYSLDLFCRSLFLGNFLDIARIHDNLLPSHLAPFQQTLSVVQSVRPRPSIRCSVSLVTQRIQKITGILQLIGRIYFWFVNTMNVLYIAIGTMRENVIYDMILYAMI